jgi:hypothetical protein
MIIELERGRQSSLDQIRDLAARFGNRIELSEGTGVFDTICATTGKGLTMTAISSQASARLSVWWCRRFMAGPVRREAGA